MALLSACKTMTFTGVRDVVPIQLQQIIVEVIDNPAVTSWTAPSNLDHVISAEGVGGGGGGGGITGASNSAGGGGGGGYAAVPIRATPRRRWRRSRRERPDPDRRRRRQR